MVKDEELQFFEVFIETIKGRKGRPDRNHRRILNGIFGLHAQVLNGVIILKNLVNGRAFIDNFADGCLWELILNALKGSIKLPDSVQMIDSTIIRSHHLAAGAKGVLHDKNSFDYECYLPTY